VSCSSCHDPKKGWSNSAPFATGVRNQVGGRSAPTIINAAYSDLQFWDGRAHQLEGQALGPIQNPIEMDHKLEDCVVKLNKVKGYREQFQKVFGTDVTPENMAKAIAAFERTVISAMQRTKRSRRANRTRFPPRPSRGWSRSLARG